MDEWVKSALEPFVESEESLDLSFEMKGSYPGLTDLRLDEAEIGIIAIPLDDPVPERPLVVLPIAYKVAYVLVHETNQLREISKQRLAGIFGAQEETDYGQWGQLGLVQWQAKTISGAIHTGDSSLADSIFKYTVLREPQLKSGIESYMDPAALEEYISKNDNGIAISSRAPTADSLVRALPVAQNEDSPGYTPSVDTVHFKDYDMTLPYCVVFPEEKRSDLEFLLRYLYSDHFADVLESKGFMPLPVRERQRLGITLGAE